MPSYWYGVILKVTYGKWYFNASKVRSPWNGVAVTLTIRRNSEGDIYQGVFECQQMPSPWHDGTIMVIDGRWYIFQCQQDQHDAQSIAVVCYAYDGWGVVF